MLKLNISECREMAQLSHESVHLLPSTDHMRFQSATIFKFSSPFNNFPTSKQHLMSDHSDAIEGSDATQVQPTRAASNDARERGPCGDNHVTGDKVADCLSANKQQKRPKHKNRSSNKESGWSPNDRSDRDRSLEWSCAMSAGPEYRTVTIEWGQYGGGHGDAGRQWSRSVSPDRTPSVLPDDMARLIKTEMSKFIAATMSSKREHSPSRTSSSDSSSDESSRGRQRKRKIHHDRRRSAPSNSSGLRDVRQMRSPPKSMRQNHYSRSKQRWSGSDKWSGQFLGPWWCHLGHRSSGGKCVRQADQHGWFRAAHEGSWGFCWGWWASGWWC